jgi:hypothetical protein
MFLTNWLILQIVAAGVTGAVEYPSAADFFMNFDSNNRLYFTGGSKGYASNLILYKGETEYPVYNGSVSNIYISDPETYVSYIQLCGETYVTNTVDVQTVVNPEGTFPDTATNIIPGYSTSNGNDWAIDFNGDGTRMVVGMGSYDSYDGRAAVYHLENGTWVQKVDIPSPVTSVYRFGSHVRMNNAGTRIFVNQWQSGNTNGSRMQIFDYTNNSWSTTPTVSVTLPSYRSGKGGIDINKDGTVFVTGTAGEGNIGRLDAHRYDGSTWNHTVVSSMIYPGGGISRNPGECMALDGTGNRCLFGTLDSSTSDRKVYESNYDSGSGTWSTPVEVISDSGTSPNDIRMSEDGTRVLLLGDSGSSGIYDRQSGTSWTKSYSVNGLGGFNGAKTKASISYDGTMVLTSDISYTDSVSYQGRAYLYEYTNGSWSLTKTYENPKTTPVAGDEFGNATALAKNTKDRIAIGMAGDDTYGSEYGSSYVYDLEYSYPTLTQNEYNKLTLNSLTPTAGRITFGSNTYDTSAATKFYVSEPGTYEVSARSTDAYAIVKKTVAAPVVWEVFSSIPETLAFHHGNFDDVYGDGDVATAAANGHVYADTPLGSYSWGTLSSNTTTSTNTTYEWTPLGDGFISDVLMVAGGGGGGYAHGGGGGGAGGLREFYGVFITNTQQTIVVGAGGVVPTSRTTKGGDGYDTTFLSYTSTGGGGGGSYSSDVLILTGNPGGSGGGGSGGWNIDGPGGSGNTPSVTPSQGNNGGTTNNSYNEGGAGGGGAGGAGSGTTGGAGANGGDGYTSQINGITYAGGGGGGAGDRSLGTGGTGGTGGGGTGDGSGGAATAGTPHTGGGGGGGGYLAGSGDTAGAAGGSGIVLLSYVFYSPPKLTYDTYNKLTLSTVSTSYSSTLRYESNTYDIGTASTIIIQDPGRYEVASRKPGLVALNSNVVTAVTQVGVYDYTQADTTEQKITASDAADSDKFGWSVYISGDYAFVGARNGEDTASNSGSVYVFLRNRTTGEWYYQQELTASDATTADFFCVSISIDGDYAIIGAHAKNSSRGAAYIFKRIGTTWTEQDTFTANDVAAGDGFGWSVGLSGDYAIAGARDNDGSGSVYIFKRDTNAETWTQHQKLKANDTASGDEFGNSVAIEGDYIIVGAHFSEHNDIANNPGNAYIFKRDGTTDTWSEYQRLTASDAATQNQFGQYVSLSGDYAIVGASNGDSSTVTDTGAAYIYKKTTTTLSGVRNPYFTDASTIVTDSNWSSSTGFEITSSQDSSTTYSQNWRAFDNTYTAINSYESTWLSGNSPLTMPAWVQIQYPQDVVIQSYTIVGRDDTDRYYPTSWQLQGATAAAPSTYVNLETNGGNRTASSWAPLAKVSYDVNTPGTAYRYFRLYVNSSNESGQVSINELKLYTTPLSGQSVTVEESWSEQQKLTASDAANANYFGGSVSISGDYAIVGAYGKDTNTGGAYIFKRDGTTWSEIKNLTASDRASGDQFGYSVSISGDYAFVGAKEKNSARGAVYIYTAENLASTLAYDGLNTLVLSNVSTGSYNTFLEGSNVLACATDLTTYPVPKPGITGTFTYSARTKSDSVYAFTNDVSITDYYKTYQYPPIDGTTTGLTSSTTSATWTISGVQYSTESSVAGSPYNTFDNSITSGFDSTSSTGDITITFESAKTIRKYIVWPYDSTAPVSTPGGSTDPFLSTDGTFRPKSWTLYGYTESTGWVSLDTVTNQPPSIYGDVHSISSPASYLYYKLSVTANNGGSGLKIGEWQLWGDA